MHLKSKFISFVQSLMLDHFWYNSLAQEKDKERLTAIIKGPLPNLMQRGRLLTF